MDIRQITPPDAHQALEHDPRAVYLDVRTEMKKVTAPSFKEIQSTTIVVIITVFIFGLYFGIVDWVLSESLERMYKYFTH